MSTGLNPQPGDDDESTTIVQNITKVVIPDWIENRREEIIALTGVAGTLVAFASDPLGFILDRLLPWLIGGLLEGWAIVLEGLGMIWAPVVPLPTVITDPIVGAGGVVLEALVGILWIVNGAIQGLATSAGPFAPLVVALLWVVIGAIVGAVIRLIPIGRVLRLAWAVVRG